MSEIIADISMYDFWLQNFYGVLPITFISREPSKLRMPFSTAITDGPRAEKIHSYAWKLQQVVGNTLQILSKGCVGQVCASVWKSLREGGEFQGKQRGHKRESYRKSENIKEKRLDKKKARQRKEQRRDIYKSIQTLNLCNGHRQKLLT